MLTLLLAVSWTCLLIRGHQHADVDLYIDYCVPYGRCLMATTGVYRDCIYLLRTHSVHDAKTCFQREKMLAGREKCRLQKCPLHSLESATVGTPALVHSFPLAWEKGLGRAAPLNMRSHAPFSFSSSREGTGSHSCARIIRSSLRIIHSRRRFLLCALASRRFASFFGVFFLFFLASFQKT